MLKYRRRLNGKNTRNTVTLLFSDTIEAVKPGRVLPARLVGWVKRSGPIIFAGYFI